MSLLRVWIDVDWPNHAECAWVLIDDTEQVVAQGRNLANDWPDSQSLEIIVNAFDAIWYAVDLPKGHRSTNVLAYALEDKLLDEPEQYHLVCRAHKQLYDQVPVVLMRKQRLHDILTAAQQCGRHVDAVYSLLNVLPQSALGLNVLLWREVVCVADGEISGAVFDLDADGTPSQEFIRFWQAHNALDQPNKLHLLCFNSSDVERYLDIWRQAFGTAVVEARVIGLQDLSGDDRWNLLLEHNGSDRNSLFKWDLWQPVLRLLSVFVVLMLIYLGSNWAYLAWRVSDEKAQIKSMFVDAFPKIKPIVDPLRQSAQALRALSVQKGALQHSDFIARFAQISGNLPVNNQIRIINFAENKLTIVFEHAEGVANFLAYVRSLGLSATAEQQDASGILAVAIQ